MTGSVFVVQEQPTGRWIAACCDARCCYGMHTLADTERKSTADAAATRHRKYLATLPRADGKPLSDECATCGQSARAITALQELVEQLEARLAAKEAQR